MGARESTMLNLLLLAVISVGSASGKVLWAEIGSSPTCREACSGVGLRNVSGNMGSACAIPFSGSQTVAATGPAPNRAANVAIGLQFEFAAGGAGCRYGTTDGSSNYAESFGCLCDSTADEVDYTIAASGGGCLSDCQQAGLQGVQFYLAPACLQSTTEAFGVERNGTCYVQNEKVTLDDPVDRYTCVCAQAAKASSPVAPAPAPNSVLEALQAACPPCMCAAAPA